MTTHGTEWHLVAPDGTQWHPVAPGGHDMEQVSAARRSQREALAAHRASLPPCRAGVGPLGEGLRCGRVFSRLAGYADKKCLVAPAVRSVRNPLGEPLFISAPLCLVNHPTRAFL